MEFGAFDPTPVDADVVILAGDIDNGIRGIEWAATTFRGLRVVYVLGNHEYYGHAAPRFTEEARRVGATMGIDVLAEDAVVIGGVRILGTTLWTDLACADHPAALAAIHEGMNDYRKIRVSPGYRKAVPGDTVRWHRRARQWLQKTLEEVFDGPTVVVSHHAPTMDSVPPSMRGDVLRAAYASAMDDLLLNSGVHLWIHGHTHFNRHVDRHGVRVLANQRGYVPDVAHGFDDSLVVTVEHTSGGVVQVRPEAFETDV